MSNAGLPHHCVLFRAGRLQPQVTALFVPPPASHVKVMGTLLTARWSWLQATAREHPFSGERGEVPTADVAAAALPAALEQHPAHKYHLTAHAVTVAICIC